MGMDHKEIGYEVMDWFHLDQDRNMIMNLWVP
jgi:hypothetical protein